MAEVRYPELGFYSLPGHVPDPAPLAREVAEGAALGLGSVWISERLNTKNAEVLSGVAACHAQGMGVASGLLANLPLRHPLVVAAYGATMSALTDKRFTIGFGRGVDALSRAAGVPPANFRLLGDYIDLLRRLWRGERVDYEGPLGRMEGLSFGEPLETPPPLVMAAMGDKTCYWAGQHCDGVIFNSLWSAEAVRHSAAVIRKGAEEAGRDPASVKIWTILVTSCETEEEHLLNAVIRRINTYLLFPPMFDIICDSNGWDRADAARLRDVLADIDKDRPAMGLMGDESTSRNLDDLRRIRDHYPQQWLDEGCAVGSAQNGAQKLLDRFDAGADGVLIHGSTPEYLGPMVAAWDKIRPAERFAGRSPNPGA